MPHEMLNPDPDVETVLENLGSEVRRRRGGRSQDWVGRACGLSQSTISRLESGQAPSLRLERYARVLAVLETGRPLGPWEPVRNDDRRLHIRKKKRRRRTGEHALDADLPVLADSLKLPGRSAGRPRPVRPLAGTRHPAGFTSE